MSALVRVGTITCPVCQQTVPVFRRGFRDPITGRAIYARSLHWVDGEPCPGHGKRVNLSDVTR